MVLFNSSYYFDFIENKDIFIKISTSEEILEIYLLLQHVALGHVLEVLNQDLLQVMRR